MNDMELEALRRAEKMRSAVHTANTVHKEEKPSFDFSEIPAEKKEEIKEKEPEEIKDEPTEKEGDKILDFLFKDKESTLILLLVLFLYDDDTDPMLIMALVYLMI